MPRLYLENIIYRWRVRSAFFCMILVIVLSKPNLFVLLLGIGVCSAGLLIRTWASGHLRKEKELTVSGPYQYTRNPLYLANLLIGISVAIVSRSLWILILFVCYFLLFYPIVMRKENKRMKHLFSQEYEEYKERVPSFLPSLKKQPSAQERKFNWKLYLKNREWRALLGACLFWLILAGKMIFFL